MTTTNNKSKTTTKTSKTTKSGRGRKKKPFVIPVKYLPRAERVNVNVAPHIPTRGEALNYIYDMPEKEARKVFAELKKVWRAEKAQARYEKRALKAQEKANKLKGLKGEQ